jgi:hypothetical protein
LFRADALGAAFCAWPLFGVATLRVALAAVSRALRVDALGVKTCLKAVAFSVEALAADARGVLATAEAAAAVTLWADAADEAAALPLPLLTRRGVRGVRASSSPELTLSSSTADIQAGATATPRAEPTTNFTS